jgi:hypothetical protein
MIRTTDLRYPTRVGSATDSASAYFLAFMFRPDVMLHLVKEIIAESAGYERAKSKRYDNTLAGGARV